MSRLFLVAALAALPSAAQPLSTDRPDFTESPSAVPAGRLQIELGATATTSGGTSTAAGPEALVRYAPVVGAELRLALPDVTFGDGPAAVGALGVGGKAELGTVAGADVGAIGMLGVPLSGGRVVPEVLVTGGADVGPGSLGAQVSAAWPQGGVVLGATLVGARGLTDRLGAFLELAADGRPGDPLALTLHHGYTLAVGDDAQADLHAGVGLAGDAPAAFVGVGWSVRW